MESPSSSSHSDPFDLNLAIRRAAHWLPTQGPIKDFVHHNTLHAFQHLCFHDAVYAASQLYGAKGYLNLLTYREAYRASRISPSALSRAVAATDIPEKSVFQRKMLLDEVLCPPLPKGIARAGLRARWRERKVNFDTLVRPVLFKLLSNYLDQGISVWRMPHASGPFWKSVGRIVGESQFPLTPLGDKTCRNLCSKHLPKPSSSVSKSWLVLSPFTSVTFLKCCFLIQDGLGWFIWWRAFQVLCLNGAISPLKTS